MSKINSTANLKNYPDKIELPEETKNKVDNSLSQNPEITPINKDLEANPNTIKTMSDAKSGALSGVTLPDGRTFLGLSPEEVNSIVTGEQAKTSVPTGAITQQQAAQQQRELQDKIRLAENLGQPIQNIVNSAEQSKIDLNQVVGAGISRLLPIAAGSLGAAGIAAATGAGAPVAPFIAAGGIITSIQQAVSAANANLKSQRSGQIIGLKGSLPDAITNLRAKISEVKTNPANAYQASSDFNEQLSYIDRDFGILNLDTTGYLKDLTGEDGTPVLADYQRFYDTQREGLIREMQAALIGTQ